MGVTKSDQFTEENNAVALIFKALGHPARVAIIEHILKANSCICGDIVKELPLAQPTVSQHLKELKNAGLIQGTIEGNSICYCINEEAIENLRNYFGNISTILSNQQTNCC